MKGGKIIKISYSREDAYLTCPYKHYLGYVEKLTPKKPVKPLFFGSDFHKLLELRNDKAELKVARKEIKEKYYELPGHWQSDLGETYVEDLFTIFKDYRRYYKDSPQPQETEHEFEILMGNFKGEPLYFIGKIDEWYKYKQNGVKKIDVGEHKTFSRPPDLNTLVMNTQKCLYAKATQLEKGILPDAVKWDYIRSTPASYPIWLEKSGRFSTSKSDKITHYSFLRACKERGIEDPEILKQAELYKGNISNFFFTVKQGIYPQMVDSVWEGFVFTAKQIAKYGHKNKTKHMTRDCKWCKFRDICHSEMTGGDTKYIIEKDFKRKDDYKDDLINSEESQD